MSQRNFCQIGLVFLLLLPFAANGSGASHREEGERLAALRAVGHAILLASGDSLSRVLPIEELGGRYRIAFEGDFAFDPENIIDGVEALVAQFHLAREYLVEFETCGTGTVAYSYAFRESQDPKEIACRSRAMPKACYTAYFTILNARDEELSKQDNLLSEITGGFISPGSVIARALPYLSVFLLVALVLLMLKRKREVALPKSFAAIGSYQFDRQKMVLSLGKTETELTSKEAELLAVLHASANATIERSEILKTVWGDEGDYIGRTLDVFVSKLRKKLEADPNVKIVNIRGIGYRLMC